jgi:hypothetical protein
MNFNMKGSSFYGKNCMCNSGSAPTKHYSVDKGSHNHPHGDSPGKMMGGADQAMIQAAATAATADKDKAQMDSQSKVKI